MKVSVLPNKFKNHYFYISPLTGKLYKVDTYVFKKIEFDEKLKKALSAVDDPYSFEILDPNASSVELNNEVLNKLSKFNNNLLKIGNKNFFLSLTYARIKNILFETSVEAFDAVSNLEMHKKNKNDLCLQRTLLILKSSKSFKKNGVLFIGASLPSGKMHAWIIENGVQPDRLDRNWIMYKPLLAIYY